MPQEVLNQIYSDNLNVFSIENVKILAKILPSLQLVYQSYFSNEVDLKSDNIKTSYLN